MYLLHYQGLRLLNKMTVSFFKFFSLKVCFHIWFICSQEVVIEAFLWNKYLSSCWFLPLAIFTLHLTSIEDDCVFFIILLFLLFYLSHFSYFLFIHLYILWFIPQSLCGYLFFIALAYRALQQKFQELLFIPENLRI